MGDQILVAYASKTGATAEIADAVAKEFRARGLAVDVMAARKVTSLEPYGFVVVGSALYAGRWRREATGLLRRFSDELTSRQVWLFQVGLSVTGPNPVADPTPATIRELAAAVGAEPPVTFAGRLTRDSARGPIARILARRPNAGDFRDWDHIRRWATETARRIDALQRRRPAAGQGRR